MDAAEIDRRVNARLLVIERAKTLHPEIKIDGKTDLEIMLETIKHVDPAVRIDSGDEKNEPMVLGMFRVLRPKSSDLERTHRVLAKSARTDAGDDESLLQKARRESKEALANAWKSPKA